MELDPRLKYLFDKGYTPDTIRQKAQQGIDPENLYYFEKGYSPKDIEIEKKKQTEGLGKRMLRGILEPVATLAVRPYQLGKALGGATPEEQGVSLPFLGRIGTSETGKDVLADIGRGIETVSLGIGGTGGASVVKEGLKGAVKQGFVQGAKVGAITGGMTGFGQSLQSAEIQPADIAYKTLFGATAGGVMGGTLGAITPVVVKGWKKFTDVNQITDELTKLNREVFKPTAKQAEKWSARGKDPIKTYTEVFGNKIPEVGKDNRFIQESIEEFVNRVDDVYKPASEGFNTILRNSPEVVDINKVKSGIISSVKKTKIKDTLKKSILAKIDDEFTAIQTGEFAGQIRNGKIPVAIADNLKDRFWLSTNWTNPMDKLANQTDYIIGKGWQKAVENSIDDIGVKAYNSKLGDLIELKRFLATKSSALAGTGGKMTRLMARVAGTVAGAKGGPIGSIIGNLTGDKLAQIMIDPAMQPYRWLITAQLKKMPRAQVLQLEKEANQVLAEMFQKRMAQGILPAGNTTISKMTRTGMQTATGPATQSVIATQAPTTFEKAVARNQPLIKSANQLPTTKPTTIANKNAIPKSTTKPSPQSSLLTEAKKSYRSTHQIDIKNTKSADLIDANVVKEKIRELDGYISNRTLSDLKKLQKLQGNPEMEVTIYRASPVNELNSGDWVTMNKEYATNIKNNNGGKVFTYKVKAKDLAYPNDISSLPSLARASAFAYFPKK